MNENLQISTSMMLAPAKGLIDIKSLVFINIQPRIENLLWDTLWILCYEKAK